MGGVLGYGTERFVAEVFANDLVNASRVGLIGTVVQLDAVAQAKPFDVPQDELARWSEVDTDEP